MKKVIILLITLLFLTKVKGQGKKQNKVGQKYWNTGVKLALWRLSPPPLGYKPRLVDLDEDGDPDVMYSVTHNNIPIL